MNNYFKTFKEQVNSIINLKKSFYEQKKELEKIKKLNSIKTYKEKINELNNLNDFI